MTQIDTLLKHYFKRRLHRQKHKIINQYHERFIRLYPAASDQQKQVLKEKLIFEAERVYPLADSSILKYNILKSKYTYWFMTACAVLLGFFNWLTSGRLFPLFSALLMAFLTWGFSILTITLAYNLRVVGAMKSITETYVIEQKLKRCEKNRNNGCKEVEIELETSNDTLLPERTPLNQFYTVRPVVDDPLEQYVSTSLTRFLNQNISPLKKTPLATYSFLTSSEAVTEGENKNKTTYSF